MRFSVEVDKYNPVALAHCLNKLNDNIPDFEYDWTMEVNAGGIDYGIYLNIDTERHEIQVSNQPEGNGDDFLEDVIDAVKEDADDEEETPE